MSRLLYRQLHQLVFHCGHGASSNRLRGELHTGGEDLGWQRGDSGLPTDANAGIGYTAAGGTSPLVSSKTPNVAAGPLVLELNVRGNTYAGLGEPTIMTTTTTIVYSRALTAPEVQLMYRSMKMKMQERGVTPK